MKWLNRLLGRPGIQAAIRSQPGIQFPGEQDGRVERIVKLRWTTIFTDNPSVRRAYLAIASYDGAATTQPILCIWNDTGADPALVNALAEPFKETFSRDALLDIAFLTPELEVLLRPVCKPFYDIDRDHP